MWLYVAWFLQEMILSLVVQLIGLMLYGYCLGAIAATITNTASPRYDVRMYVGLVTY